MDYTMKALEISEKSGYMENSVHSLSQLCIHLLPVRLLTNWFFGTYCLGIFTFLGVIPFFMKSAGLKEGRGEEAGVRTDSSFFAIT